MAGDRDEGQAAVELALVLPLVVLLLLALVQVTLVARDQILLVHLAREAARAAAVAPAEPLLAARRATGDEARHGFKENALVVDVHRMPGLPAGGRTALLQADLRYRSPTEVPLVGALLPDVELRAKAAMRPESGGPSTKSGRKAGTTQEPARPEANNATTPGRWRWDHHSGPGGSPRPNG